MERKVEKAELERRLTAFCILMNESSIDWDTAVFLGRVNQYYFTGTMQDGLLIIKRSGQIYYFIKRSFERASDESPLVCLYKMDSYKDAASLIGNSLGNLYIETDIMTVAIFERFKKYFSFDSYRSMDSIIMSLRAVKSAYELYWTEYSGKLHFELLNARVPYLMKEGISEAEFVSSIYSEMMKLGHQGVSRFSMYQTEMVVGQVAFGESSLYATSFDGPGGQYGMSPAVPIIGSTNRKLTKGDLVFVDVGFGVNGYHTDKTQVYMFGAIPEAPIISAHRACMNLQDRVAGMLRPNAIPSQIYTDITNNLDSELKINFMGFGDRKAKFIGHGVGLHVDEYPVIAAGFNIPLKENMVIALEPKKGIEHIGMVGVEETYIVTGSGGKCITGGNREIIVV